MRDPALYTLLRATILPDLVAEARKRGNELRLWSAGCGTGEEAYSLAILVDEVLGQALDRFSVRIFATDMDREAIDFARRGIYPAAALERFSPEIRRRYFTQVDGALQVSKAVRSLTVFGVHDLAQRAPFPRIDMVLCRDVLGHFTSNHQQRTLELLAYSMRNGGYLALGKSEATSPPERYLLLAEPDHKIYRRSGAPTALRAARSAPTGRSLGSSSAERAPPRWRPPHEAGAARLDLPIGVIVLSPRYDIAEINPAARSLLGIHGPAAGEDLVHLIHSPEAAQLRASLDAALRGEAPPPLQDFLVDAANADRPRHVAIVCRPQLREASGAAQDPDRAAPASPADRAKIEAVLVTIQDTTSAVEERRRFEAVSARSAAAEQEIRASMAALETEAASLRAAKARLEASVRELSAALEAAKTQQRDDAAIAARNAARIRELEAANVTLTALSDRLQIANDDHILSSEAVQAANQETETLNEEFQATNEELETLNEEFQATIEELNTTNEDLEARGLELADLARTTDAERERLAAVLVSISDSVLVVDSEGRIALTNKAYSRTFDTFPQTILDESGKAVDPEKMPDRRAARGESFRMEFSLPIKDDGPRDFEAVGQPIRDKGGPAHGGVVVIRDISERSMRRMQDRFLAMASHELRTPLVPMQGYLQLLVRSFSNSSGATDDDRIRYANNAMAQGRRIAGLVDEIVDATRLQTGKFHLSCAPMDFGALVAQIVQSAESLSASQTIAAEIEPGPMRIHGDAARIEQVVLNLLSNAIQYASDGACIQVRARRVGDEAELEVEDHGPGIAAAELPKLFWPFYQVADVQHPSRGGLGLGLFICREIVTSHGGRIAVRSVPGKGTVFTVRLRLLLDCGGAAPETSPK